jgi:diguanylate cyclase (GGDEF)-like protein
MPMSRQAPERGEQAKVRKGLQFLRCYISEWWLRQKLFLSALTGRSSLSLANRILLLQFTWTLVVYGILIVSLWYASSVVIESSLRSQGESWLAKLDELGTPFYASEKPGDVERLVKDLEKFPEIAQVIYYSADGGKELARYSKKNLPDPGLPSLTVERIKMLSSDRGAEESLLFEKGRSRLFRFTAPIIIKSIAADGMLSFNLNQGTREKVKVIGFVSVILDYSPFYADLYQTLRNVSFVIAILMLIVAALGRWVVRWSLRLLTQLEEPLHRLARGETDVQVESSGDQEIAKIGKVLNTTISALRERDETLQRMVNQDPMTGLMNRNHFGEVLEEEITRLQTEKGSSALFFIDLDRFKFVNDTYGHDVGDRLLIQVANMLNHRMRKQDCVARYGGDEFTALVVNVSRAKVGEIAQSMLDLMNDYRFQHKGEMLKIHFSIGITMIDSRDVSAAEYLVQADKAVHQAKQDGRNRYHIYVQRKDSVDLQEHNSWHAQLTEAIANERILLYYQKVVRLKRGKAVEMYEALVRLQDMDKENGLILPSAFFTPAERFEMMTQIDRLVIKQSITALNQATNKHCILSINLSEQTLKDEHFIEYLEAIVTDSDVDTSRIIFEISERVAVYSAEQIKPVMDALTVMGFGIAIDDYGAGYASFQYLKHSHIQWLKLDNSLIEGLSNDPIDQITVKAIAQTAAQLGIETVAKFVPDQETVDLLKKLGVTYAQGFYLHEPGEFFCETKPRATVKRKKA